MLQIGRKSEENAESAWNALREWFVRFERSIVLVSGGVDSSLLLSAAANANHAATIAVTADSPSLARSELTQVKDFVAGIGVKHVLLKTGEIEDPRYRENRGDRCYFCKKALYEELERELPRIIGNCSRVAIVDGTNVDDLHDHRPSRPASKEHGIRHPYVELGISKSTIREVGRLQGLSMWDKPAMACLSSRVQTGVSVSSEKIALIESAECALQALGFTSVRVRYHESGRDGARESIARIEVPEGEIPLLINSETRLRATSQLRALGFSHVTIDLEGYKRGGRATALSR